jgi:uncharacterized protein (DUF58 family)
MLTTKEVIAQVKKIELQTRKLVDGLIAGNYHSIFKGQGIEFSEIRDYRPGDDVRAIDWKVTARFNHTYIKEFIEERDLRVYFAFDMSASGNFGKVESKRKKAIELAATLMFSAMRNSDNVGMFLFTDHIEQYIPARKGRRHILKCISQLVSFEPTAKGTNLNEALSYVSHVIKKRSVIFIISDFISPGFHKPLSVLRNKHDVIAIQIKDERETGIPDVGLIELEDEETGEQLLIDTSDKTFREKYAQIMNQEQSKLEQSLRKNKVDSIQVGSNEPYVLPLKRFFSARKKRGVV